MPWTCRRSLAEFLSANPGFVCPGCLASALTLPDHQVTMAALGLARLEGFEYADRQCSRCGARRPAVRAIAPGAVSNGAPLGNSGSSLGNVIS
jgi:hypothetical protein